MPLSALEKTPTGWGHGVKGVGFVICEKRKDKYGIVCKAFSEQGIFEKPEIFEGNEIITQNAKRVEISPLRFVIAFEKTGMVWVDSGIIYCKEED